MPRRLLSFLLQSITYFGVFAEIEWLADEYNFGTFKEADGPVKGSVAFVNKGPGATFIGRVRPGCGCTSASYPHRMIEPGDTAVIEFTYNPAGRPGRFDRSVKIYTGDDNDLKTIRILGTVIGDNTTLESVFPFKKVNLRFDSSIVAAGEIRKGEKRNLFINCYNDGKDTVMPSFDNPSKSLDIESSTESIAPGEIATIRLRLNTEEESCGPVKHMVGISDGVDSPLQVEVRAIVVADTRGMTAEEIDNGPRAYLLPEFVDLGKVENGKLIKFEFKILNEGKSEMKVERVYCEDSAVVISRFPEKVRKGKKGKVEGSLNVEGLKKGPFRIKVEVVTNDLLHPVRTANIVGIRN